MSNTIEQLRDKLKRATSVSPTETVKNKSIQDAIDYILQWRDRGCSGIQLGNEKLRSLTGYPTAKHFSDAFVRETSMQPQEYIDAVAGPAPVRVIRAADVVLTPQLLQSEILTLKYLMAKLGVNSNTLTAACQAVYGIPSSDYIAQKKKGIPLVPVINVGLG